MLDKESLYQVMIQGLTAEFSLIDMSHCVKLKTGFFIRTFILFIAYCIYQFQYYRQEALLYQLPNVPT
jgi:hypothetical protein